MALVSIEYEVYEQPDHLRVVYVATDQFGGEHRFGPVITYEKKYDPEGVKEAVRVQMEEDLAQQEALLWAMNPDDEPSYLHATKEYYQAALDLASSLVAEEKTAVTQKEVEIAQAEKVLNPSMLTRAMTYVKEWWNGG